MLAPDRQQRLTALRDTIADIERKPPLGESQSEPASDHASDFPALPGGLVQEIYADEMRDAGASLGFALAQAQHLVDARRPAIFYLQLAKDALLFGLPYGPGLSWLGLDPRSLVIVRTADMADFLWAAEEVIACAAVAAVVADIKGEPKLLNFTASRRLSLRASAHRVTLFVLRYGQQRDTSASHLRWHMAPHRSGRNSHDNRGLGPPRWHLTLEKGRIAGSRNQWLLEWTKNGMATVPHGETGRSRPPAAFPGALPAVLAHRLPQAG